MNNSDIVKICKKCNTEKLTSEFYKEAKNKDGLRSVCKECHKKYVKEDTEQNKDIKKQYNKLYRKANREKLIQNSKEYYQNHKKEICNQKKQYYINNETREKKRYKEYYSKNKERILKRNKDYYNTKIKNDLNFKLRCRIRCRVKYFLRKIDSHYRVTDIGCSMKVFMWFIEQQFYPNPETNEQMTWNNYGYYGWHLDHIIPLSSFDLTDPEQYKKATHVTNYQPLWAKENYKKSNKLLKETHSDSDSSSRG